ncbi:ATP-grasp domain-containing protein [Lysobacter sp. TAB13]|uniref:ATP-grasp domain-containing protein n=1 Tax=Lysobacter sp. TAB13 TaxID=3233065 RepID=UPI003F991FF6
MSRLALVTAIATAAQDDDLPLLHAACLARGLHAEIRAWDDPSVAWARYDTVLLRSPWDYTERFDEFTAWCERVDALTRLLNPWPVLRWNTDKHYLADLAARGVPVVTTAFVEPEMDPLPALQEFLLAQPQAEEFVVKPAISAGSRDTQRYARAQEFAAANHIARLLDEGRSAMLQPYLASVDRDGETALMYFNGVFSHAIRKGAMLQREDALNLRAVERINAREAGEDERAVALHALTAMTARLDLEEPLAYARVDLIRDGGGQPQLLELELCEPSLFFAHEAGSADRFAEVLAELLETTAP